LEIGKEHRDARRHAWLGFGYFTRVDHTLNYKQNIRLHCNASSQPTPDFSPIVFEFLELSSLPDFQENVMETVKLHSHAGMGMRSSNNSSKAEKASE